MPEAAVGGLRERNKREKLARITAAARELFRAKGFEETTAREICERAGVGTGTLFLYVRDKRELLFLTFESDARRLFAEGKAEAARTNGLVAQLMCLFGRFTAYYAVDRALSKAIVQELFFRTHDPGGLGRLTREFAEHVADLVAASQTRGELRADLTPARAAMALFAHYAYWTLGWLGTEMLARESVEPGLRRALELQVEGLGAQRETRNHDTRR
jgi:AcrR family transcriptional regulator